MSICLVLSLFPGIGFLDLAFEEEGFCIVRGPDLLWGGDIRAFHPPSGPWGGILGGPPCQNFSSLIHLIRARGCVPRFGNLIPEFERCVAEARPRWFLMENVRQAPRPDIPGYLTESFLLNNCDIAGSDGLGQEQVRERRFTWGMRGDFVPISSRIERAALRLPYVSPAVLSRPDPSGAMVPVALGGSGKPKRTLEAKRRGLSAGEIMGANLVVYDVREALRLQGFPEDYLDDCPLTKAGKMKAIANGVPLPMGRAIAKAVRKALEAREPVSAEGGR